MLDLLAWGDTGWGDELVRGTLMTLAVALCSFALGQVFGALGATAKLNGGIVARGIAEVYTTVVRGVPELLVIYLLFFGTGNAIMAVAAVFGYTDYIEVNAFTIGVLSVGLISGAYSTEVIRGAIQAVPFGQIEAGRAVGMRRSQIFFRILLPQTLRYALPGLGNVWQLTLKDTALISVTALAELMRSAQVAAGVTRDPFLFYTVAAALYLVLTSLSTVAFDRAERYSNRGVRRA
ncbi:ABC transporter permease [Skermanella mucosa]|uniref:ABC transporter permease n=1 Tax=Skermanella mucosa TaxID=1789672 RepID=UPI00192C72B1|nr:ABC transporter permease [Skermanella mucosa]UEM20948.1 ABC transporter permease [Skermanella mucosa]